MISGFVRKTALFAVAAGSFGIAAIAGSGDANAQATLAAIKQRGALNCGVDTGIPGFAYQDAAGKWIGLDVDYCRALAAAVVGDAEKVKYVPTTAKVRFTVLQSGEIDVLIRDSTLTFTRNTELKLHEAAVNFYTGQAFMVKKSLNAKGVKDLNGATICMVTGATLELNIADYNRANNVKIDSLLFDRTEEAFAATESGRCDGYTDDGGSVAAARSTMKNPKDWDIIDEVISKEPLGAMVRKGDDKFFDIVRWTYYAMTIAEEHGITSANIDDVAKSATVPEVRRMLGLEGDMGKALGVDNRWAYNAIKQVGNFAEVWDRNVTPFGVPRGINNLWNKGGLHYAPPLR